MELSRRRFVQFLSAAPALFALDPHRVIFDMGRSKIWTPPPPEILSAGDWIELGPQMEYSIDAVLAQYGAFRERVRVSYVGGRDAAHYT